jgi:hypothetical protein
MSTLIEKNILTSFEVTGIWPMNSDVILQRSNRTPSPQRSSSSDLSENDWQRTKGLVRTAVKDIHQKESKKLSQKLHHFTISNQILKLENKGLREAFLVKMKHQKQGKPIDLQQRQEYHDGAVFWSPSKVREARVRERAKQQQEESEKLQKAQTKELREAHNLYKKRMAEEAKALRESVKEARAKERQKAAEEAAARRAQKEQEKRVRHSQKALQQSQRGKRAASEPPKGRQAKRRSNNSVGVGAVKTQPAPPAPPKTTQTRSITAPIFFSE